MFNILLLIHIIIAILLITVILLQKTNSDGTSTMASNLNNMGVVGRNTATNFFVKTTIILATIFMINSIVLANLSSRQNTSIEQKFKDNVEDNKLPIAE